MSRPWRDGDRVIDPDGTEWTVAIRGGYRCLLECPGARRSEVIADLLARGWKLKEEST